MGGIRGRGKRKGKGVLSSSSTDCYRFEKNDEGSDDQNERIDTEGLHPFIDIFLITLKTIA